MKKIHLFLICLLFSNGALFSYFLAHVSHPKERPQTSAQIVEKDSPYIHRFFNLEMENARLTGEQKGLSEGERKGQKSLMILLQNMHRFQNVPDSKRDSMIAADYSMRCAMMANWRESLYFLDSLLPDWPFLHKLVMTARNARILSIYEADTMGLAGVQQSAMSIIPLTREEYLLYYGQNTNASAYYLDLPRMIVLRCDYLDTSRDSYSLDNAETFVHELCHDYLYRKGFKGPKVADGDPYGQHDWIDSVRAEINRRLDTTLEKIGVRWHWRYFDNPERYFLEEKHDGLWSQMSVLEHLYDENRIDSVSYNRKWDSLSAASHELFLQLYPPKK